MAAKKPAAKASVPPTGAPKKTRKAKSPSMSMKQKFDLLAFVKDAPREQADVTIAEKATAYFGRKVTPAQVKTYRAEFGIASVPKPHAALLEQYIGVLKQALLSVGATVPDMPTDAPSNVTPIAANG